MRWRMMWLLCSPMLVVAMATVVHLTRHPLHPVLVVLPVGPVDEEVPLQLATMLAERLALPVRVDAPRELPDECFHAQRDRYDARCLMTAVQNRFPSRAWKVLVATEAELYREDGWDVEPVVGLSFINGSVAVVSMRALQQRSHMPSSYGRRLANLVMHEMGHSLGLHHCQVGGCVMRESDGDLVAWADLRSGDYCLLCQMKLGNSALRPGEGTGSNAAGSRTRAWPRLEGSDLAEPVRVRIGPGAAAMVVPGS